MWVMSEDPERVKCSIMISFWRKYIILYFILTLILFLFIGEAGEGLVELRRIETAEEIAHDMAASRNVVYLPQGQSTLLALPQ